ncbi:MAG TPA: hypothetical protein PKD85_14935 [Saprospiraceae bacterium]|nr:hypothetical protein [Saprospiraceae bacterium]
MKKEYKVILLIVSMFLIWLTSCQKPEEFEPRNQNKILSISLAYKAEPFKIYQPVLINHDAGEIQFRVPRVQGTSFKEMKVFITIPTSAIITPAFTGITDLSAPYRFSVIAENGDKKDYLLVTYN